MVTDRFREDLLDFRLPPSCRDEDYIRQARQAAKLPVLPLAHDPKLKWSTRNLSLVKHDGNSTLARSLQVAQHTNEPGTVSPTTKAKGIIFDNKPVNRTPFASKAGSSLIDCGLLGSKNGFT